MLPRREYGPPRAIPARFDRRFDPKPNPQFAASPASLLTDCALCIACSKVASLGKSVEDFVLDLFFSTRYSSGAGLMFCKCPVEGNPQVVTNFSITFVAFKRLLPVCVIVCIAKCFLASNPNQQNTRLFCEACQFAHMQQVSEFEGYLSVKEVRT